ncbi:MAG: hypothetical protein M0029_14350 [Actinomycetota bacterium]|nr:hypothetical protein [Actinomycetota bacterium]
MPDVLVRVVLPDRPGALGAVASRIGSVGGDVVSIDILERSDGAVVDELGVVLADEALVELMTGEILEVDGAAVEAVRRVASAAVDPRAELLAVAIGIFHQASADDVLVFLVDRVRARFGADHVAIVPRPKGRDAPDRTGRAVDAPPGTSVTGGLPPRLDAGALAAAARGGAPDAAVADLAAAGAELVVVRRHPVLRQRERTRLAELAELADHRWSELAARTPVR